MIGRGKSADVPKMEGLQVDQNEQGDKIPAIITDNQVIQSNKNR